MQPSTYQAAGSGEQERCSCGAQETIAILRAEVEQLQFELSERDALLAEYNENSDESELQADEAFQPQLLERLEDLLAELDLSDERIATLEELLKVAEEANCAEREERRQLESWVHDIESVIAEREITWDAEMKALQQQAAAVAEERDQLLQRSSQPASTNNSGAADNEELERLRLQVAHLGQQLNEANAAGTRFQEELRRRDVQLAEAAEAKNKLRQEHLALAQERASLTRLRAEIAAKQAELQSRPQDGRTEIDNHVRVFREHLREIHEEEKQENNARRLSSRIAQLWKRVEGNG